jgi:hypothetical protein
VQSLNESLNRAAPAFRAPKLAFTTEPRTVGPAVCLTTPGLLLEAVAVLWISGRDAMTDCNTCRLRLLPLSISDRVVSAQIRGSQGHAPPEQGCAQAGRAMNARISPSAKANATGLRYNEINLLKYCDQAHV